jgi:hypothetical protein
MGEIVMFDLVFLFTGLCAFAMEPSAQYPAERLDVVLVETSPHIGMLVVSADQLVQASGNLPPRRTLGTNGTHVGFPLEGRIVRVVNGAVGSVTWSTTVNDPGCPTLADRDSYEWVVPFNRIAPGKGQILATMRRPSSTSPPTEFHAKVELEAGQLSAKSFARTVDDEVLKWEFNGGPGSGGFDTALADLVEVRQSNLSGTIVLQLEQLVGAASGLITLTSNGRNEVLVEIFNQPEPKICCNAHDSFKVGDTDDHFCHLFGLVPSGATCLPPKAGGTCEELEADLDHPHRCRDTCASGVSNPQCPGAEGTNP